MSQPPVRPQSTQVWPLSGVHSIMMEKFTQLGWEGGVGPESYDSKNRWASYFNFSMHFVMFK
jgi:hypothetical protein